MDFKVLGVLLMIVGLGTLYYSDHKVDSLQGEIGKLQLENFTNPTANDSNTSEVDVRKLQIAQDDAKKLQTPAIGIAILGLIVALSAKTTKKGGE